MKVNELTEQLAQLVIEGLTLTECLNAFANKEDDPFYLAAVQHSNRDGDCEIHFPPVVAESEEGAYVLAWVWASNNDAGITNNNEEEEKPG